MDSHHRSSHLTIAVAVIAGVLALAWAAAVAPPAVAGSIPHLQWTSIYAPTVNQDSWNDVAMGPGHTVYVCGTQNVGQGVGEWIMTVARYNAAGKLMWETPTIPGVKTWADSADGSEGNALAVDHAGNVIVVGASYADGGGFAVVKFSGVDGHVMWKKDFMLVGPGPATDVVLDSAGNAYVTGTAVGGMSTGEVIYTAKFRASDGRKLWENLLGPATGPSKDGRGIALAIDAHRNTYVVGHASATSTYDDWMVQKISPAGKTLWAHKWRGPYKHVDMPSCLALSTGAVYVAGTTQTDPNGSTDAVVVKYNLSGKRLWTKQIKLAATQTEVSGMCFDSYGHLLLAGQRRSLGNGSVKTFLTKLTANGKTDWLRSQASPSNPLGAMAYFGIVKGPTGSMYLSGYEAPSATDDNMLIEKRTSAGKIAWRADYGWQDNGDDSAGALVRDGTTALYVSGEIRQTATFYDATLQRFKP